jgi:hypothetical protein
MLYRRMKRPRRQGEDAFDVVRTAGLDAKACLAKFREIAHVETMTWPEADRLAFDTTTSPGVQQQAEWNQARADFELVLMDVRPLAPEDVAKMREGERL